MATDRSASVGGIIDRPRDVLVDAVAHPVRHVAFGCGFIRRVEPVQCGALKLHEADARRNARRQWRGIDFDSVGWRFGYGLIHRTVSAVAVGRVSCKAVVGSRGASVHRRIVVHVNASIHRLKDEAVFIGADVHSKHAAAENFPAESGAVFELKQEPCRIGWRFDGWFWLPEC